MKFVYFVSALFLIPASAAFIPLAISRASLKTKTPSSLNGYVDKVYSDRSGTEEEEIKAITKSLQTSKLSEQVKEVREWTPEEEKESLKEFKKNRWVNPTFKHLPTKALTGVNEHIARCAATLSNQLYDVPDGTMDKFIFSSDEHEVDTIIQDLKGIYQPTNPPFAAVVCGDTMIIGWRGSKTITDFINDAAWSPCSNIVLGEHAKNIKLQGGVTSLCLNDIAMNQDVLIAECVDRGIKEIVTTGHSLGGGLAQVGHTILRAQMQNKNSPWFVLNDLSIRSLGFSGMMTTQIVKADCSDATLKFIEEINDNSCQVVYHNDVVPRIYGFGSYISAFVEDATGSVGEYVLKGKPFTFLTKRTINKYVTMVEQFVENSDDFQEIVRVWSDYIHPGTIVSYKNYNAKPQTLVDYGAFHKNSGEKDTFRSVKYEPVKLKGGQNAITDFKENHSAPLYGMEYKPENLN